MTSKIIKKTSILLGIFVLAVILSFTFIKIRGRYIEQKNMSKEDITINTEFDQIVAFCSSTKLYPGQFSSQYNRFLETNILSEEDKYIFAEFICNDIKSERSLGANPIYSIYLVTKDSEDYIYVLDEFGNNMTFKSNLQYKFSDIIKEFEKLIGAKLDNKYLNSKTSGISIDFINLIALTEDDQFYNVNYSYLSSTITGIPEMSEELEEKIDFLNMHYNNIYTKKIYCEEVYRDEFLNKQARYESASSISFEYYQLVYNGEVYVLQMVDYLYSTGEFEVYVE